MNYSKALAWSGFWIVSALMFALGIGYYQGMDNACTFLTAYIVEKMLSFDNLFMFYVIFAFVGMPPLEQRKALNYGIIGAVILRGLFIFSGCFLVAQFHWLLYGFAAFLIYSGIKIFLSNEENEEETPSIVNKIKKIFPGLNILITTIIIIEITDIMFAMDSIPAILSITQDNFLVYSSNLFAILGLRSLYFVMLELIKKFIYLQYSVGTILTFIGAKMLIAPWVSINTAASLIFIITTILTGIILSGANHD